MNDVTRVVDVIRNSAEPISGITVRSSPTMPPTKALTRTSSENCRKFSARPSRTAAVASRPVMGHLKSPPSRPRGPGQACVQRAKFGRLGGRFRNIGQHGADEGILVVDAESCVVPPLEADGGRRLAA